jgi:hypothetical protein
MTPCEQRTCFIFGNFCFEILARRLAVWTAFKFLLGDWFLDFYWDIACLDCFQILARRLVFRFFTGILAVQTAFRFWPGDWLSGLLSDFGQEIGF